MGNNNKKKMLIDSAVGVILLLLVTVLAACAKDNNDTVEVADITEDVNVDNSMSDVSNEEQENLVSDTEEKEADKDTTATEKEEASNTEETSDTEEPTEKTETSNTEDPAIENAETTNKEETANTESNNTESAANKTVTSSNWGTPQEYNGDPEGKGPGRIIVKGFDYNDFDNAGASWQGEYWTASNGVEIKVLSVEGNETGMLPVPDGKGKDLEPNSPFQVAFAEAFGIDINKFKADMNVTIPLATYKRTEIDINDANIVAFRNAYDYKLYSMKGMEDSFKPYEYGEGVNLRLAVATDGVAEFDITGAKFWQIRKVNDYWEVRMNAIPADFRWEGIHQILRYLSPDGDSLYDVIYEDVYYGRFDVLPEYDEWYSYQNSQVMVKDTENMGYMIYYFK